MFQCVYLFALFVYFRIHYNLKLQNLIFFGPLALLRSFMIYWLVGAYDPLLHLTVFNVINWKNIYFLCLDVRGHWKIIIVSIVYTFYTFKLYCHV